MQMQHPLPTRKIKPQPAKGGVPREYPVDPAGGAPYLYGHFQSYRNDRKDNGHSPQTPQRAPDA